MLLAANHRGRGSQTEYVSEEAAAAAPALERADEAAGAAADAAVLARLLAVGLLSKQHTRDNERCWSRRKHTTREHVREGSRQFALGCRRSGCRRAILNHLNVIIILKAKLSDIHIRSKHTQ
jgi:hypothetical protein